MNRKSGTSASSPNKVCERVTLSAFPSSPSPFLRDTCQPAESLPLQGTPSGYPGLGLSKLSLLSFPHSTAVSADSTLSPAESVTRSPLLPPHLHFLGILPCGADPGPSSSFLLPLSAFSSSPSPYIRDVHQPQKHSLPGTPQSLRWLESRVGNCKQTTGYPPRKKQTRQSHQ